MDAALQTFLKLTLTAPKEEALAFWVSEVQPQITEAQQTVAHAEYKVALDQRWWAWCKRYQELAQGRDALQRLLLSDKISWEVQQTFQENALASVVPLTTVRTVVFAPSAGPGYVASSPFVLRNPADPEGFLVNVRHVNYRFTEDNQYPLLEEYVATAPKAVRSCVRTKNVVHVCAPDLTIRTTVELADQTTLLRWPSPVLDLEDVRLVALPGGLLKGVAASREVVVSTLPQPVLFSVDLVEKACKQGIRLRRDDPALERVCQKNWLPFWCEATQRLLAFYAYGPTAVVVELDPNTGVCNVVKEWVTGVSMRAASGGAPPVAWEGSSYLSVVHTSLQQPGVRRKYVHRFVLHDADYRPVAISQQWNFSGAAYDAEFVISCARATATTYYLGYGQNDGVSKVAEVATDTIKALWWYKLV